MRNWIIGLVALVGGCSCDRTPDAETSPAGIAAPVDASVHASPAIPVPLDPAVVAAQAKATAASSAVSSVHAYLGAVAGKDWKRADAFWTGGKPPPRPDDHALRAVEDLRSMRINNDSPTFLDEEAPPRALEVPVTLRVRSEAGVSELKGWYRLRRRIDSEGWEITSASLQPTLD